MASVLKIPHTFSSNPDIAMKSRSYLAVLIKLRFFHR